MRGNDHFRLQARIQELAGKSATEIHVIISSSSARIAYRMVAGSKTYRHPGDHGHTTSFKRLIRFYENHRIDIQETMNASPNRGRPHLPSNARSGEKPDRSRRTWRASPANEGPAMRLGVISSLGAGGEVLAP